MVLSDKGAECLPGVLRAATKHVPEVAQGPRTLDARALDPSGALRRANRDLISAVAIVGAFLPHDSHRLLDHVVYVLGRQEPMIRMLWSMKLVKGAQ
jgi:hypothetical protein